VDSGFFSVVASALSVVAASVRMGVSTMLFLRNTLFIASRTELRRVPGDEDVMEKKLSRRRSMGATKWLAPACACEQSTYYSLVGCQEGLGQLGLATGALHWFSTN
jgi:hypothetical protein